MKTALSFIILASVFMVSSSVIAENKVVVIPLNSSGKYEAKSGQTMRGHFNGFKSAGYSDDRYLFSVSYPFPLPEGTPLPTLVSTDATTPTTDCPGEGTAAPGKMCMYIRSSAQFSHFVDLTNTTNNRHLWGKSIGASFTSTAGEGNVIGTWAYQVP